MNDTYARSVFLLCLLTLSTFARAASAQAATETLQAAASSLPSYDIASIKPHKAEDNRVMARSGVSTYEATNVSLQDLIAGAYGVRRWLVFGLPSWAQSTRFDIQAKISDPDLPALKKLTNEQRSAMLVSFLKDRFHLVAHGETKTLPVFDLTVTPGGPRFHESPPPPAPAEGETPAKRNGNWTMGNGQLRATSVPIATLADSLSYQVERFIVDKTGLTGVYDLSLRWTPEDKTGKDIDSGVPGDQPPAIYTALKEQLGLQLSPSKGPVPTLVVDHAEMPEQN